ncbi:MAG: Methylthioribulose-1-phosphate dehydratase [Sodalis sp.]|uniref:class II aldolase/adducin family protein n=1 Tax=Sodalis sp. (in: enterobacteria) TaxID=1898979 RepID=UPI0038738AEA|nr:MAG: Methylthioribulose-1-phosphate dehydratase [Sodalis sp.]
MSQRRDAHSCFITTSGLNKGDISPDDFVAVDIHTSETQSWLRPSAETSLHAFLYRCFPKVRLRAPYSFGQRHRAIASGARKCPAAVRLQDAKTLAGQSAHQCEWRHRLLEAK